MYSPSPLYFVLIGFRALWCAVLGCGVASVLVLCHFPSKATPKPPADDLCLILFLGSITGAVVSISFAAGRLWRLWLVNKELRELRR
jgi:hypothetical protein